MSSTDLGGHPDPTPDPTLDKHDPHSEMHAEGCRYGVNGACWCGLAQRRARWSLTHHPEQFSDSERAALRALAVASFEGQVR